jgi:hypothetical protein
MDVRPTMAALSLLLVLLAPCPGDLAGEPADASAEIAVVRATSHAASRHIHDAPPASPACVPAPDPELAPGRFVEAPFPRSCRLEPRAVRDSPVLACRPPPVP